MTGGSCSVGSWEEEGSSEVSPCSEEEDTEPSESGVEGGSSEETDEEAEGGGAEADESSGVLEAGTLHPLNKKHKKKIINFFIAASWEKQRGECSPRRPIINSVILYGSIPLCVRGVNFFGVFSLYSLPFQVFLRV